VVPNNVPTLTALLKVGNYERLLQSSGSTWSPYRVTCEHELESHVKRPTRLFLDHRDVVVRRLNQIPLPTKQAPRKIPTGHEGATETLLIRPVVEAIKELKEQIKTNLDEDRREQDSPEAVRLIHARCRAAEWGSR
jgi:hypothetical protein